MTTTIVEFHPQNYPRKKMAILTISIYRSVRVIIVVLLWKISKLKYYSYKLEILQDS